MIYYKLNQPNI